MGTPCSTSLYITNFKQISSLRIFPSVAEKKNVSYLVSVLVERNADILIQGMQSDPACLWSFFYYPEGNYKLVEK